MDAEINIVLHQNQRKIHESPARFKVIKAGKRFGKSKWAVYEIIKAAGKKPNGLFWYVAPTFGQAKDIAWSQILYLLPKKFIKNKWESVLTVELINGAKIVLKGAENEDALRGVQIDGLIMDEAAYVDEYVWPAILRGQLSPEGFAYFISSPNKKGRNWWTGFCEEANRKEKAGDTRWAYFYFTIYDNPTYPKSEIEDMKLGMPDDTFQLEYMAVESAHSGQIYHEFSSSKHVSQWDKSKHNYFFRGVDWGMLHPTICLWGSFDASRKLDPNTNPVYISDELFKSDDVIADLAAYIKKKTGEIPIEFTVIDPSTKKRNSQTLRTDADEFSRWGVPCIAGDNRDRGYDITKMFFKRDLIRIDPTCKNLISQLRSLQWTDKDGDDCPDTLRYMLVRIHDITFNGQLFESYAQPQRPPTPQGMVSFNDPLLFPQENNDRNLDWTIQEVA